MVLVFSWERFDEPSYSKNETEFFRIFAPRFSAIRKRYNLSRLFYILIMITTFFLFSTFPRLVSPLISIETFTAFSTGPAWPLFVSTLILGIQNAPGFKELERKIRSGLHAIAEIPQGVRRTVSLLMGAKFNFSHYYDLIIKSNPEFRELDSEKLDQLVHNDRVTRRWVKVSSLIYALRQKYDDSLPGDLLPVSSIHHDFLSIYRDEFDYLSSRQGALRDEYRDHVIRINAKADINVDEELQFLTKLKNLRDRVYTFLACGIRSSHLTDQEIDDVFNRLGFQIQSRRPFEFNYLPLLCFGLLAVFLSIVVTIATIEYLDYVKEMTAGSFEIYANYALLLIPKTTAQQFLWSVFSALFYSAAISGALSLRAVKLAKGTWFDRQKSGKDYPIQNYVLAIFIGGFFGYLSLYIVAGLDFTVSAFTTDKDFTTEGLRNTLRSSVIVNLYWTPVVMVMCAFVLYYVDTNHITHGISKIATTAAIQGILTGGLGFVSAGIAIVHIRDGLYNQVTIAQMDSSLLADIDFQAQLFIGILIAIFSGTIGFLFLVFSRKEQKERSIVGKSIELETSSSENYLLTIFLNGTAEAKLDEIDQRGTWVWYPDMLVVNWEYSENTEDRNSIDLGVFGFVTNFDNTIFYEGYSDFNSLKIPQFTAIGRIRNGSSDRTDIA